MPTDHAKTAHREPVGEDWFLAVLVRLANEDAGFSPGLTLLVGGTLVSGRLASGRAYFERFAKDISGTVTDAEAAQAAFKQFDGIGALVYDKSDVADDEMPSFIHLKDARVLVGPRELVPSTGGIWWRGRIAAVDGFTLGEVSIGQPPRSP